jgi:hypothetical protein
MSHTDEWKHFKNASPEEKLYLIRHTTLQHTSIIRGYAEVIRQHIKSGKSLPEDFADWVNLIHQAGTDLEEFVKTLTDP